MPKHLSLIALITVFIFSTSGCAQTRGNSVTLQTPKQPAESQVPKFTPVEGASLAAKMDTALKAARSASQKNFWTAYTFDVRPGVAIDPNGPEFSGSMMDFSGVTIFMGTSRGLPVETRNLGIFLLRDSQTSALTRMEIYNLERPREYSGYPVYWAARAANEESINYLNSLAESNQTERISERAVVGLALHDDPRVVPILKNFINRSRNEQVRETSVFWLGVAGGEQAFLADLVRNERERENLRQQAAHAIGLSRDKTALSTLQTLYDAVKTRNVRQSIIHAVSMNDDRVAAMAFLTRVARTDSESEIRGAAIHWIGQIGGESAIDTLMNFYNADRSHEVRQQVLHALSQIDSPRSDAQLLSIARSGDDAEIRGTAIHWLGQKGGERVLDELMKMFDSDRSEEVRSQILHALSQMKSARAEAELLRIARGNYEPNIRGQAIHWIGQRQGESSIDELMKIFNADHHEEIRSQILHAFSQMKSPRAETLLLEIARSADDSSSRQQAIHWLGQKAGERSLNMLSETVNSSNADTDVQTQAVHAISQRPKDEAIPLLIKIARTHRNPDVRRAAIHWLGQYDDPRVVEFFREMIQK